MLYVEKPYTDPPPLFTSKKVIFRREGHFGAGQLGAVLFRRRTFGRRFIIIFSSIYEEKTTTQAIP